MKKKFFHVRKSLYFCIPYFLIFNIYQIIIYYYEIRI